MDRKTILKNLAAGFLPLLIFIIADELFDLLVSLAIALGVSLIYLLIGWLRDKRIDRFALLDVLLIGVLGGVSLAFDNPAFLLVKPAVIELVFVALIGVTVFTKNPLLIRMTQRYMGGAELSPAQQQIMRRMLRGMFWLLLAHTAAIVATAIYVGEPGSPGYLQRKELWAFVSGGLLYLLLAAMIVGQFIKGKAAQRQLLRRYRDDEWFDLVTPEGKVIGKAPRSLCHGNPDLLHPVVHVHVFNSKGELWLQKRGANKEIQPGKWDTSVGGHVSSGEKIEQALLREVREELGIDVLANEPLFRYVMRSNYQSELVYAFRGFHDGPFHPPKDEIEEGRFWKISEIRRALGKGILTPNFEQEFALMEKLKIV
ncbi:MAG: NUDIX domain-containing protein [candidate division KSB1 bacterium]|nr:NUDIX domain-containing protein [candidate division KSB1 bacterium]